MNTSLDYLFAKPPAPLASNPEFDGFIAWMSKVDAAIAKQAMGLTSDDLIDCTYSDWFEDGFTPSAAARMAIKEQGGF